MLGETLDGKEMYEEALVAHQSFLAAIDDREGEEALMRGYEEAGYEGAMRQLAETIATRARISHTDAYSAAMLYFRAGENDLALAWMERAFADRDPSLLNLGGARYDSLRDDPRFQDLLRRMDLPLS